MWLPSRSESLGRGRRQPVKDQCTHSMTKRAPDLCASPIPVPRRHKPVLQDAPATSSRAVRDEVERLQRPEYRKAEIPTTSRVAAVPPRIPKGAEQCRLVGEA